ncbi:polysaccharide deacetylase family protein [Salinicoccus bachuensis]|uniref:Polysaccharide deacetylase family protein n=1 Tax=Salinicoccus bachuensis TaxID=3136731 RepID=A0ABZ3CFH3_9STAP
MFKKRFLLMALCSSMLLAGCQADGEEAETDVADAEEQTENQQEQSEQENQAPATEEAEEAEAQQEDGGEEGTEDAAFQYEVNADTYAVQPIESSGADPQVALLTYDDAPDGHAVEIAEILAEHDAPAIFFVNGMYLESEAGQEALRAIHEMGFEIGNHTETHASLPDLSPEAQREEIASTNERVEAITGERPRFFRAPFGQNTEASREIAEEEGMELMNWTYGYDWEPEYQNAPALADIMVNTEYLNHGANLLMHDRSWTRDASAEIVEGLRDKGYALVDPALIASPKREEMAQ